MAIHAVIPMALGRRRLPDAAGPMALARRRWHEARPALGSLSCLLPTSWRCRFGRRRCGSALVSEQRRAALGLVERPDFPLTGGGWVRSLPPALPPDCPTRRSPRPVGRFIPGVPVVMFGISTDLLRDQMQRDSAQASMS